MWPNQQETAVFFTFTKEVFNEKLNFFLRGGIYLMHFFYTVNLIDYQLIFTESSSSLLFLLLSNSWEIFCKVNILGNKNLYEKKIAKSITRKRNAHNQKWENKYPGKNLTLRCKTEILSPTDTAQKMKFFNKDFFSKFDQIFQRNL